MIEEMEFLKDRGREFWERGYEDFQKERYNLCIFDIEQALQLWLKYLIALKTGNFPKTHYLSELIEDVLELYPSGNFKKGYEENILAIKEIEDAYITSRYFPRKFSKQETEAALELSLKFVKILENETKNKFI